MKSDDAYAWERKEDGERARLYMRGVSFGRIAIGMISVRKDCSKENEEENEA